MPDEIALLIAGREYAGWESARVTLSMEAGAGTFDLAVSERWPSQPSRRTIRPGQACEIKIGRDVLIRGYVDEVAMSLDAGQHTVGVRGRDKVADLIDCAPDLEKDNPIFVAEAYTPARGQWSAISLLDLAKELATPFGIEVRADPSVFDAVSALFEMVTMNPGERVFELLEHLCRYRQVLPISDGRGGLLLTCAGTTTVPTPIVEGQNLLAASVTYSHAERFSGYVIKGQSFDLGTRGANAGLAKGYASDREITRYRPLLQVAEQATDPDGCKQRARWEALTRAARGSRIEVSVQGWRQPRGALWPVNARVTLQSRTLGVEGEFLITEVAYSLPSSVTQLTLARPDAYRPGTDAVPPPSELGIGAGGEPSAEEPTG